MILEIRIYFSFILHFLPYVFFVEIRFWFLTVKVIWPFLPIDSGGPHSRTFIKFASCGGQLCILRCFKSLLCKHSPSDLFWAHKSQKMEICRCPKLIDPVVRIIQFFTANIISGIYIYELNNLICKLFLWILWYPWNPWGRVHSDLKRKKSPIWLGVWASSKDIKVKRAQYHLKGLSAFIERVNAIRW